MKHKLILVLIVAAVYFAPGRVLAEGSRLDGMISPINNPLVFEDPRITTEVRPAYVYHDLDSDFATGGGSVQLIAAQARLALTDRLGLIATKDGYLIIKPDQVLPDTEGSANLEAGLKYAFYVDEDAGSIATAGLRYQIATGDPEVFQGEGDGLISPFLSGAMAAGDFNLMGFTQLRLPFNSDDSTFWDVSFHADYPIGNLYPVFEANFFHVLSEGERIPITGEGADVINFGASDLDGKSTLNLGVGLRYRFAKWLDGGVGWEFDVLNNDDVYGWRITTDLIFKFDFVCFS
ncbi:MAG: hypothetical protein KDD66_00695 [Bdellovibrionales bacterium]|nr:hypothetical protein [Bdellovibrionales bacterium]